MDRAQFLKILIYEVGIYISIVVATLLSIGNVVIVLAMQTLSKGAGNLVLHYPWRAVITLLIIFSLLILTTFLVAYKLNKEH